MSMYEPFIQVVCVVVNTELKVAKVPQLHATRCITSHEVVVVLSCGNSREGIYLLMGTE